MAADAGAGQGPPASPQGPKLSWAKRNRNIIIVVMVVAVIAAVVFALACYAVGGFLRSQTLQLDIIQWLTNASLNRSNETADHTIALVIGGSVYQETVRWYGDHLEEYRGQGFQARGIHVATDTDLNASMLSDMHDAITLLENDYGLVIEDNCYMHIEMVSGFGYEYTTIYVGMLEVSGTWYVGYATNVIDVGNI